MEDSFEAYLASYDDLYERTKGAVIRRAIERFYPTFRGLRVLEIGAGRGTWTRYFLEAGAAVTCVDTRAPVLEANKAANPKAETVVGDAVTVSLNKKFDVVFAKDVIEHIPEDERFLRNMNVHLKDGGGIVINTQNSWSLNFLVQGGYHRIKGDREWCGWDPAHVRFYNFISLRSRLERAEFRAEAWFGSYYFPYRIAADHVNPAFESKVFCLAERARLSDRFPIGVLGWNIGVVGRKIKSPA